MKYVIDLNDDWVAISPLRGKELTIPITIDCNVMYVPTDINLEELGDQWDEFQIWKLKNCRNEDKETGLCVGDEIEDLCSGMIAVVTYINSMDPEISIMADDGSVETIYKSNLDEWEKTGRHFDGVNNVLRKMREDQEE